MLAAAQTQQLDKSKPMAEHSQTKEAAPAVVGVGPGVGGGVWWCQSLGGSSPG